MAVFGLLTLAHVWRAVDEGSHALASLWFIGSTTVSTGYVSER